MSKCFIEGIGCSGGGSAKLPAIYVQYPEGSICTCTNGDKTYTAKDATGFWLFAGLSIGKWTVTATDPADPTNTASQTVEITTEGQSVSVTLSYLVPPEYQAVEYLESTGTQYINPDISGQLYTRKIVADVIPKSAGWLFGETAANPYFCLIMSYSDDIYPQSTYNGNTNGEALSFNTRYKLTRVYENGASNVYSDGTLIASYEYSSTRTINPYLFCRNYASGNPSGFISAQLYYFAIYEADGVALMREFIPCYRKADSVAGLWDTVSKAFFTNAGTGTFIVGADI